MFQKLADGGYGGLVPGEEEGGALVVDGVAPARAGDRRRVTGPGPGCPIRCRPAAVDDAVAGLLATNPDAAVATKALLQQAAGNSLEEQCAAERKAQVGRLTALAKAMAPGA